MAKLMFRFSTVVVKQALFDGMGPARMCAFFIAYSFVGLAVELAHTSVK